MRRLIASLVILLFVISLSFAQGMTQQKKGWMGTMSRGMMGMQSGMMGGMHHMYSMMIHHILMKSNTLNLTDAQKKELANIREKYLYPMVRKEADFKVSHMKIMDMLQDPNFDPIKVKTEIKASSDISFEIANMSIDALTAIRKAIGVENFKKVKEMMSIMGSGMMQSGTETMIEEETMKKELEKEKKENSSSEHKEHHENQ